MEPWFTATNTNSPADSNELDRRYSVLKSRFPEVFDGRYLTGDGRMVVVMIRQSVTGFEGAKRMGLHPRYQTGETALTKKKNDLEAEWKTNKDPSARSVGLALQNDCVIIRYDPAVPSPWIDGLKGKPQICLAVTTGSSPITGTK